MPEKTSSASATESNSLLVYSRERIFSSLVWSSLVQESLKNIKGLL